MTTSPETDWMNHPVLRRLVDEAKTLTVQERITLVKGLVPGIAADLDQDEYDRFVTYVRLKGERYHEAVSQHGSGRSARTVPGDRELEGR